MAPRLEQLTLLVAREVGVASCAITIMGQPVDGSDQTAGDLEDWQFVLAQGPAVESARSGRPVEYANVETMAVRCPMLAGYLVDAGIRSIAAFPIMLGTVCVGTTTLYSTTHRLRRDQRRGAQRWTDLVAASIGAEPDLWANRRCRVSPDFHTATGCVMATSNLDSGDASAVIRAHAFAEASSLRALCHRIVYEQFTLDREPHW